MRSFHADPLVLGHDTFLAHQSVHPPRCSLNSGCPELDFIGVLCHWPLKFSLQPFAAPWRSWSGAESLNLLIIFLDFHLFSGNSLRAYLESSSQHKVWCGQKGLPMNYRRTLPFQAFRSSVLPKGQRPDLLYIFIFAYGFLRFLFQFLLGI